MFSLNSKITQKFLSLIFLNEKERFYVNELAKLIKEDPSNVYKKLLELKKEGLLSDEFSGKERYFFLNQKYPFLKEYKKIILKGFGFEKILKEELSKIEGIDSVYIFGSYAKNKLSLESDIDILIIGDFDTLNIQKKLLEIQRLTGRELNSVELTKNEFARRKEEKEEFITDVFSSKYIKVL
ncbi:MAG: nucleotidyltransferase domain-containing protein [Candidatus Nealsonbacteria bacterium]